MSDYRFVLGFSIGFLIDKISLFPLIVGFTLGTLTTSIYNKQILINYAENIYKYCRKKLDNIDYQRNLY